jgi:hypothetical protein
MGPPPRRGRGAVIVVVLAIFVAVGVLGLGAALLLTGADSDDESQEAEEVDGSSADLVAFDHPDGAFELSVPQGWAATRVEGDVSGLGSETFPDDPLLAQRFQQMVDAIPRALIFVSVDPQDLTASRFVSNFNVVRNPVMGGTDPDQLLAQARAAAEPLGAEVTDEGTIMTPAGEVARLAYDMPELPGVSGIHYLVAVDGEVWSLTFTSDDLPAEASIADAVASTFVPAGAG